MGSLSDEEKNKIREIIRAGADKEADVIIDFADKLNESMPEGISMKEWAEKQAKAFADAREEITKKFTDCVKEKMKR